MGNESLTVWLCGVFPYVFALYLFFTLKVQEYKLLFPYHKLPVCLSYHFYDIKLCNNTVYYFIHGYTKQIYGEQKARILTIVDNLILAG